MKKYIYILLISVIMLTGCSKKNDKKQITLITHTIGNQYWSVIEEGARNAAAEMGANITVVGLQNLSEIEKQVQLLQDAVSAKSDLILIGPVDSIALAPYVAEAYKSGIPIIIVDTEVGTDDFTAAFLTDNYAAGEDAAAKMIEMLKEKNTDETVEKLVAVQMGTSGSQSMNYRLDGFNDYWSANAPAKWRVLNEDIKINDGDIVKATSIGFDFFTAYKNLVGVYSVNNGSSVGFATALKEANRKDLVFVGFDFSSEIEELVRAGEYSVAAILQRQYFMGYEGVKLGLDFIDGKEIKDKITDTGVIVVDKNNVNSDEVKAILNP